MSGFVLTWSRAPSAMQLASPLEDDPKHRQECYATVIMGSPGTLTAAGRINFNYSVEVREAWRRNPIRDSFERMLFDRRRLTSFLRFVAERRDSLSADQQSDKSPSSSTNRSTNMYREFVWNWIGHRGSSLDFSNWHTAIFTRISHGACANLLLPVEIIASSLKSATSRGN